LEAGMDVIKVSAKSRTNAVAGAIAGIIREHKHAVVHAIGAGAVNQAVKAAALARHYLEPEDIHICVIPYFTGIEIDGKECTAIEMVIEPRNVSSSTAPVKARELNVHA